MRSLVAIGSATLLALALGCSDSATNDTTSSSSAAGGAAGTTTGSPSQTGSPSATGSSSSTGTGGGSPKSDLPIPPGPGDLAQPSGAPENLRVVAWAGFASAVSYTFDDGQPSHIEHWDELKATGVPVTFYINTGNSGIDGFDAMFSDAAASGSEVANHTVHHCHFDEGCNGVPAGSHDAEIDGADDYIEANLGVPGVYTFAYPFGDTGYEPAAEQRYFIARGVGGGTIAPSDSTDPWNLPCFAAQGGEAEDAFDSPIDSSHRDGRWLIFLFHSILPTSANWYAGVDVSAITGSISHAKGLGDVWIDSVVHVGAYWAGQRAFEGASSETSGDTTLVTWTLPDHFPPGRFVRVTVGGGTLSQGGVPLTWDGHGYYEVSLDAGSLTLSP